MTRQAHKSGRRPEMPFEVNHALWGKIETQVTDGLRMAILSGFYKPGDILPSQIELARALGVSTRAPQTALRVLAEEGLVSPRTKRGTLVLGPRTGTFRGRVVIVQRDNHPVYYNTILEAGLCNRLTEAGYLVARVAATVDKRFEDIENERTDVRQLVAAALLAAGIHTGRDVLFATLANMGIAPVHPDPIDLLARDPERDASVVADAVLSYLATGTFPSDLTLGTEFVAG